MQASSQIGREWGRGKSQFLWSSFPSYLPSYHTYSTVMVNTYLTHCSFPRKKPQIPSKVHSLFQRLCTTLKATCCSSDTRIYIQAFQFSYWELLCLLEFWQKCSQISRSEYRENLGNWSTHLLLLWQTKHLYFSSVLWELYWQLSFDFAVSQVTEMPYKNWWRHFFCKVWRSYLVAEVLLETQNSIIIEFSSLAHLFFISLT